MNVFGNPNVRFDVFDGHIKLMHLRRLHKIIESALLEYPIEKANETVGLISSEPWDEPVSDRAIESFINSNRIEARVMARFHRQSTLSTAFAVFEFTLLELAVNFWKVLSPDLNPQSNRDRGLTKVASLFSQAGHPLIAFRSTLWKEIKDIAEVRNKVMHSGGLIPKDQQAKFSKIAGVTLEEFSDGAHMFQLCIDYDYILRAFRLFDDFLEGTSEEVKGILNANP